MCNLEWEVAHDLVTPAGTLYLNQVEAVTNRLWQVEPEGYKIVPSLRVVADNLSQADGSVLHPRYKTGLVASLKVTYRIVPTGGADFVPACGADLREMNELLVARLNSIRRTTPGDQRLIWTPTADPPISRRMLDDVQALAWTEPERDAQTNECSVTFQLETPLPYAIDLTQVETHVPSSSVTGITNSGTADFKPVVKVNGPFSFFVLSNNSVLDDFGVPLRVVYDSTRPGAVAVGSGHYAEIDFFRGLIFLDGNSTDLTAGLDPTQTDFWPLAYDDVVGGANNVEIVGADCDVLWNPAWS